MPGSGTDVCYLVQPLCLLTKVIIVAAFNLIYCEIKDSMRQKQRGQQLEEELKMREQELENTLTKQKEVGFQILLMLFLKSVKSLMIESTGCVFVLSWRPESGSWAVNRPTSRSRTSSCGASTSSYRSRWIAAESSCRPLWVSSACCRSALPRNKWPDRSEWLKAQTKFD